MGYAISWIALRNTAPETAMALLGLSATGKLMEIPESMFSGTTLPSGWYLVIINECEHRSVQEKSLRTASAATEVVAVSIEEHVMVSTATYWKSGAPIWTVTHDSEKGEHHLEEQGNLPEIYQEIKARLLMDQQSADGVDYIFSIPLELAGSITGFMHDSTSELEFEALREASKQNSPGLFTRLFGKR